MARIRTRSQFNFDSASRQLDTRDLDSITDPTTDLGGAVADAVEVYGADSIQPIRPGFDMMAGQLLGPGLSLTGSSWGGLAAVMGRAPGFETYPAVLPSLGAWTTPSTHKIRWTPTLPGIYQWYAMTEVEYDIAPSVGTYVAFREGLPAIIDETWGGDAIRLPAFWQSIWRGACQGMLVASAEMLAAGWGGLNFFSPETEPAGSEAIYRYTHNVAVLSWSPAGTVPYFGGI